VCVATSATIVDEDDPDAARGFASRFFGVPRDLVVAVGEAYEPDVWVDERVVPVAPTGDGAEVLATCVGAVDDAEDRESAIRAAYKKLSGDELATGGEISEALHAALSRNELVFQISESLATPRPLNELPGELEEVIGRPVDEAEILAWLTLGATARKDGRPLLRPVVHGFIRGISGAVVSFPDDVEGPSLWLAAEDEIAHAGGETQFAHFPVLTCSTCGQHYFVAHLKDFGFSGKAPDGGEAEGTGSLWEPLTEALGGHRVVLTDSIVGDSDDEGIEGDRRTNELHFCRFCGAAHPERVDRCLHCGAIVEMVPLFAIRQKPDNPGFLTSCLSCGSTGRRFGTRYREPARPVRATNVADVHVLAQDMVHHSARPRLLVFCDNRQDAAFQAGWMKDHARRFRLRALMAEAIGGGATSVGDVTHELDERLSAEESLSRALVPEVWQVARREGSGGRHDKERRKFLRIQVLREVTMSARQTIGLEPWGRVVVEYDGLDVGLPWIRENANALGLPAQELKEGVATLLDYLRRKRALHDPEFKIFTKYWMDGDLEVQQGYLPQVGGPVGTKLRRGADEKPALVTQWVSDRGDTTVRQIARKWGVEADDVEPFLEGLFDFLKGEGLLVPVRLLGARGNPLPGLTGIYQVDADRLRLQPNHGVWQCRSCRRRTTRRPPHQKCPAWRCSGELEFVREDPDNYDLQVLDEGYSMLRPAEHTAMVPHDERERLENLFKGKSDAVNCFVCTPTLELGVDIGALDSTLMRNVPPLPANYWQRAGRAGRRHRMAVDMTYCRPVSHDRAYFADPLKLLAGKIDPPAFNLSNEVMVGKHVHATVITRLHQLVRDTGRAALDRERVAEALGSCLPRQVSHYLFEGGEIRIQPINLSPLENVIEQYFDDLVESVEAAFAQGWPAADAGVTSAEALRDHVAEMVPNLEKVVERLRSRLLWAVGQIKRLNQVRERKGDLELADDALYRRCDRLIKRLKGTAKRTRREAEGVLDVNTFGVLAAEGFLPGYGLETGSIVGAAEIPFWQSGGMDFALPRPPAVALREYVPGNLIYANGNRFVARNFHRDVDEDRIDIPYFEVSTERKAVKEIRAVAQPSGLGSVVLPAISVCDVDLAHMSHISDEEELRFQMGVTVYGIERDQHGGGRALRWGAQGVHHRRAVSFRLVNVGSSSCIDRFDRFGYPVCAVCGQSVSPLSSEKQRDQFLETHTERCGRSPENVGFFADVTADAVSLVACDNHAVAYSVLEALRMAATRVLDMHLDDLQILVIGYVDREEVDGLLWDPMPGGSGLLDQLCARFGEVAEVAREIVAGCPSACESSCIDCLQTYRNAFYHGLLDRKLALEKLDAWGDQLIVDHAIPPKRPEKPSDGDAQPVNEAERRLRYLLLGAGFAEGTRGQQIKLGGGLGTTTPDVIYRADHHDEDEGVCIYLDGLSQHLHGNPATAERDGVIRSWLRNSGYEVIEIAVTDLHDQGAMTSQFKRLAGYLREDEIKRRVKTDTGWFDGDENEPDAGKQRLQLHIVQPQDEDRFKTCVPLLPLAAAAGGFSDSKDLNWDDWGWVGLCTGRRLRQGMFVAQVVGRSMEPKIADGSYCLFASPVEGSRQGKIVLAELDDIDPDFGARYTIKVYESEKVEAGQESWRHVKVTLKPINADYQPIEITCEEEGSVRVRAEFLEVVGTEVIE
jgi:SOS-response transcriptional repressor LexA